MFLGLLFFSFVLHLGDFASFQAIVLWEKSKDFMQWNGIGLLIMKCLKIPFKIVSLLSCLLCISMYMTQNCFIVWVRFLFYAWMVHRSVLSFQQKNKKTPPNLKVFCFKMIQESLASWRHNINNWEVACDLCTVLYDSFTGFHFTARNAVWFGKTTFVCERLQNHVFIWTNWNLKQSMCSFKNKKHLRTCTENHRMKLHPKYQYAQTASEQILCA